MYLLHHNTWFLNIEINYLDIEFQTEIDTIASVFFRKVVVCSEYLHKYLNTEMNVWYIYFVHQKKIYKYNIPIFNYNTIIANVTNYVGSYLKTHYWMQYTYHTRHYYS